MESSETLPEKWPAQDAATDAAAAVAVVAADDAVMPVQGPSLVIYISGQHQKQLVSAASVDNDAIGARTTPQTSPALAPSVGALVIMIYGLLLWWPYCSRHSLNGSQVTS